jgi:hypothetical protein
MKKFIYLHLNLKVSLQDLLTIYLLTFSKLNEVIVCLSKIILPLKENPYIHFWKHRELTKKSCTENLRRYLSQNEMKLCS